MPNGKLFVIAKAIGNGGITPTGTVEITENGTYDVGSYASAEVNVQQTLIDKDDGNKLYAMAWSIENGHPVLTLTERT